MLKKGERNVHMYNTVQIRGVWHKGQRSDAQIGLLIEYNTDHYKSVSFGSYGCCMFQETFFPKMCCFIGREASLSSCVVKRRCDVHLKEANATENSSNN